MASPVTANATARADAPSAHWRAALRLAAIAGWLLICLVPHYLSKLTGRSHWPRRFLSGTARLAGADVRLEGCRPGAGELLIANHVSWLDIPVLAGATGCAFVSKAEVRGHPFLKWIADQNHTLYVDRSQRRDIQAQAAMVRNGLSRGQPLAVFPEGTVGDGGRLLPFKPALLAAVTPPPDGATVRPVAIDYQGTATMFAWRPGEHGVANFFRVLGRKGRIPVTVRMLDVLPPHADRKTLARTAHDAIAIALAPSGIAPAAL
ncbi:MAG TPA: lysophospholipid acyltransferase family protein [Beijerinckiaceae bacterium]|nr:lysophospholipid acyltransferase family protein [Beijerinckiaceae bacterium]